MASWNCAWSWHRILWFGILMRFGGLRRGCLAPWPGQIERWRHLSRTTLWVPLGTVASCRPFLILFRESTSLQVLGILGDHLCLSRKQMVSPVSLFEVGRGQSQLVPRWAPYNPRPLHTTGVRADHGFSGELSAGGCNGPTSMQGIVPIVPGYSNGCIGPVATQRLC